MSEIISLEERCVQFSKDVAEFTRHIPKLLANSEYSRQIIRSSASVGANYIEAGESLSKKDFIHRARIARKEAKETSYWLQLIIAGPEQANEANRLKSESNQLMLIFSSIASKVAAQESSAKIAKTPSRPNLN